MASLSGDIAMMNLSDLTSWIGNRKIDGVLQVQQSDYSGRFVIREGALVQAKSSDPREFLGQHLINFGYITEEDLAKAYTAQQETHIPLGRILVMVGSLTQSNLDRALLFKARESLLNVLAFSHGTFRFTGELPDVDLDTTVPILLHEVCSEASARKVMWTEMRRVLPADAVQFDVLVQDDQISGIFDQRLLAQLRLGRSIGQAGLELRASNFHTYARLYDLFQRRLIKPVLSEQPSLLPFGLFPQEKAPAAKAEISAAPRPISVPTERPTSVAEPSQMPSDLDAPLRQEDLRTAVVAPSPIPANAIAPPTLRPIGNAPILAQGQIDPHAEMRLSVNAHDWSRALILAERIVERDAADAEAIAVLRVAKVQLRKLEDSGIRETPVLDGANTPRLQVPRAEVAQAHLTSKERYVLARIDGSRTLNQIAAVCPVTEEELHRIVAEFIHRGVLSVGSLN